MGAESYSAALDPERIADEVARVRRLSPEVARVRRLRPAVARVRRIRPAVDAGLDRPDSYLEATLQALADTDG